MSPADGIEHVTGRLVEALDAAAIPYFVMGGLAVTIWGLPRATFDLDLTLLLPVERTPALIAAVEAAGFEVDAPLRAGYRDVLAGMEKSSLAWTTAEGVRVEVDLFFVTTAFQEAAFARRVRVPFVGGRTLWVVTPADLILFKLLAGRAKDLADVQNLLAVQGAPEPGHLRGWAERLGVTARLEAALVEAGLTT